MEENIRPGNEVIREQTVELDGAVLKDKSLIDCRIVYSGGRVPVIKNCDFIGCHWAFEGEAQNTVALLANLISLGGEGRDLALSMIGIERHE